MTEPGFDLNLPLLHAGKVRRLYAWPSDGEQERLLMVATDAVSAFDHVLEAPVPDKGAVLTGLSLWWFEQLRDLVPNHVVSTDVPEQVIGRAIIAEKLAMVPVECVARGYLTGSAWSEYQASGTVCGITLPEGLLDGSRLPEPIFTPAIKAPLGEHDENVDFATIVTLQGEDLATRLRDLTLAIYARAEEIARERGLILADTKFEFGLRADGSIVLADEVLTPDSSRFWDAAKWRPGVALPSFDKQYLRDWLAKDSGWDRAGDAAPPVPPTMVIAATRARYVEAYERLTGTPFHPAQGSAGLAPQQHTTTAEVTDKVAAMSRVIVDVMPKPEILDPQGKAVTGALKRLGFEGLQVRQGKRFEVVVDGELTPERLDQIREAAERLLANTVIESFDVRVEA
ncbi:MAG: phosphoribosylaminoimidazolesuccinocarboxamide synthase [Micropruina sp.]